MLYKIIIPLIVIITLIVLVMIVRQLLNQLTTDRHVLTVKCKIQLMVTGLIAFIADTAGIGSFAVEIAFTKYWKLVKDQELPGLLNGAQILPGAIESILFLQIIHVQAITLITLVIGACLGGILGGTIVSHLNRRHTQLTMSVAFIIMAALILIQQLHLFPIGSYVNELSGWKLWLGFFGMIVCGFTPALGVGLFAVVEILLFLLGLSPIIAFPIMTTAGALQQPLTALTFVLNKRIPLKQTMIIACAGVVSVLFTVPFITHLSISGLHWLLLAIVIYNAVMLMKSYLRSA